jgi:hypothetical protein
MGVKVTRRRESIWLGQDPDEPTPIQNWEVKSEDDMIMIEAETEGGEVEVFICPELFPKIRAVMDRLEARGKGSIT